MHIVGYVTRSSTKNKCTRNTAKGVQASKITEVINKPNQVLESQPTTNKNPQSITQSARHDNRDIAIDSLIERSKKLTNCPLLSKRRRVLTRKQQAVKQAQEQLQVYGQPIKSVPTTKLSEVLLKPTRLYLIDDNDLDVRVKHENVKEISAKELVFEALLIKLRTVFQIL